MLSITPIHNNYYNRNISFRAETSTTSPYAELYKAMQQLEITEVVEQEIIPPAKETPEEQTLTQVKPQKLETLPCDNDGCTELYWLIRDRKEKEARKFIKKHPNFDINQRTKDDYSYIELAMINKCDEDFVSELAANKALNLSITDKTGWNDMHNLCLYGYTKAVQTVIDNHPNLNLNQLTKYGFCFSYIDLAKMNGHTDIVKIFEKLQAPNKQIAIQTKPQKLETLPSDNLGYTELHRLMSKGKEKGAREFIQKHPNFDINQRTNSGSSYIELAVFQKCDEDFVTELAANKALDLSITDNVKWNDLHHLCYHGYSKAVQAVIDNHPNLNLNQLTKAGDSYIGLAKERGHKDIAKILEKLQNPNKQIPIQVKSQKIETLPCDNLGYTELHCLIRDRKENEAREFIKKHPKFDINQCTKDGYSYIRLAVINQYDEDFVSKLAANKALDLSITDKFGWNDLHRLIKYGYTRAVLIVVDNHPNLDIHQLTDESLSYEGIARIYNHKDIIRIFEKITQVVEMFKCCAECKRTLSLR